jgi:hypothetical protein
MNNVPIFLRSRVLTSLLALLALAITAAAALMLPAHYRAESDVSLLPSVSSSKPYGFNPFLSFNSSLPTTAQIISYQVMDPVNVQKLKAEGYNQPFIVSLTATISDGPILTAVVTGSDKVAVQRTLYGVTQEIFAELASLQRGISKDNRITILPISTDLSPQLMVSKTARPLVLILGLGLVFAFAVPRLITTKVQPEVGYAPPVNPDETAVLPQHDSYLPAAEHRYARPASVRPDEQDARNQVTPARYGNHRQGLSSDFPLRDYGRVPADHNVTPRSGSTRR